MELSEPAQLAPLLTFLKKLGVHVKNRLTKKASHNASVTGTCDSFFVMYVVSRGVISDLQQCVEVMSDD